MAEHHAAHLRETSGSAYLYCSLAQVFRDVGPEAYKIYLSRVLRDAGDPTDPIERMLIEQICLAHHNIGRLHVKTATTEQLEEAKVYLGAAALLTGEFRRSIATLKTYREPTRAHAGNADAPGLDAEAAQGVGDGEVGSNRGDDDHESTIPLPEPPAGRGRPEEPGQTTRSKRRRA